MKQLLQRFDTGELRVMDVPVPEASGVQLLVRTNASVISAGTERALVEFSRSGLLEKARRQPDKVRQVIERIQTDGIGPTMEAVRSKLRDPITLGYCSAGTVEQIGPGVRGFAVGDRVVSNGPHGEFVLVPQTLVARIPENVSFEKAAFTPLAAIALQGIRMAQPELGELVVVYGLGLVGQLSVQLLRANGCRVIGVDRDPRRLALAEQLGALVVDGTRGDVLRTVQEASGGIGADAVLLTLTSDSDEPVHEAAAMSRKRGRIVLVGVTGLGLRRDDFYRKELSFKVSCSYGPGRYDGVYEEGGIDYPVGFVRWTEQRNFGAVLQLMSEGSLDPGQLITHRFDFSDALTAYDLVTSEEPALGIVLQYASADTSGLSGTDRTVEGTGSRRGARATPGSADPSVAGIIGAGAFAQRVLLPAMKAAGFRIRGIASQAGTSAAVAAERFGADVATTSVESLLSDPEIGTVFVLTRHDSHSRLALRALIAGKNVFVEKPLALRESELDDLERALADAAGVLTVGFNRRFAPLTSELREELSSRSGPASLIITVNAGEIPPDHWTQDRTIGGGRIAGEACHFVDLARTLIGHSIHSASAHSASDREGRPVEDICHLVVSFEDGSTATIHYLANGSRRFPKERIEAFFDGRSIAIENWRRLRRYGGKGGPLSFARRLDKGHSAQLLSWIEAVRMCGPQIPYEELFEVSRWTLRLAAQSAGR
jgi:predicted dehydrogenase/threonine dehydrogenase-like Zn-dependent dehydrogenase